MLLHWFSIGMATNRLLQVNIDFRSNLDAILAPFWLRKSIKIGRKSNLKGNLKFDRSSDRFFLQFGSIWGAKLGPCWRHFRPKGLQKPSTPNDGERPGADLVAIWRRKRSKDAFLSIWACFLLILEGFLTNFGWILKDFPPILDVIFVRIQAFIFQDFF